MQTMKDIEAIVQKAKTKEMLRDIDATIDDVIENMSSGDE